MSDYDINRYLTKSDFMQGLECPKKLWLNVNKPFLGKPEAQADRDRMRVGREIGTLARQLYPNGIFVPRGQTPEERADKTQRLIDEGAECLFEATFIDKKRLARVDILQRTTDGWTLDEVKSSTARDPQKLKKDGKVHDVEFQAQILNANGLAVAQKKLVLIDNQYVYPGGDYDYNALFAKVPVNQECAEISDEVLSKSDELLIIKLQEECPIIQTNTHCKGCKYFDHCHENEPKHRLTLLPGIRSKQVDKLRAAGYLSIDQIPEDHLTAARMKIVRDVIVSGKPYIDAALAEAIETIKFPAAFVDFESIQPAIPKFPGTRPYMQICFQWSAHIMANALPLSADDCAAKGEGAGDGGLNADGIVHKEFLFDSAEDPREDFCRTLYEAIKDCGSFIHYAHFEVARLKEMVECQIPFAEEIMAIIETRGIDLEEIVKDNVYFEEFCGHTSIKYVLPAFVPEMTYKGMAIADGTAATSAFNEMISDITSAEKRAEIRKDLLAYCSQDTLAMVKVYEKLKELRQPLGVAK